MDIKEVSKLSQKEERKHWWIKTRFLYIDRAINYLNNKGPLKVIEFGHGTGQNLWYLQEKSDYKNSIVEMLGVDPKWPENFQVDWAKSDKIKFSNDLLRPEKESAHIALAMDVLEHIDDENSALQSWHKALRINGLLLITVPAFQALWSYHDEFLGHKRRYTKKQLNNVLKENGFETIKASYGFSFIFPLVYLIRKFSKGKKNSQDLTLPPFVINSLLYFCGRIENFFGGCPFFGTSVIGVYRKK